MTHRALLGLVAGVLGAALLAPPAQAAPFAQAPHVLPAGAPAPSPTSPGLSADELAEVEDMMKSPLWQAVIDQWARFGDFSSSMNPATAVFEVPLVAGAGSGTSLSPEALANLLDDDRGARLRTERNLNAWTHVYDAGSNPALFAEVYGANPPTDRRLVLVSAMNFTKPSSAAGETPNLHGEQAVRYRIQLAVLEGLLAREKATKVQQDLGRADAIAQDVWDDQLAVATPREPCPSRCRKIIPKKVYAQNRVLSFAPYETKTNKKESAQIVARKKGKMVAIRKVQRATASAQGKQAAAQHTGALTTATGQSPPACQTPAGALSGGGGVLALALTAGCGESPLMDALASPSESALGGIDFTSLQMRYLSDSPGSGGLRYSFSGQELTSGYQSDDLATGAVATAADDLRTWIALTPEKFWVNLNPNEPERIVDADLGRTNAGKVMLEADFEMKRTEGALLDPDTRTGAAYWRELERIGSTCSTSRAWITPGRVEVRADGDSLYVLRAELDVKTAPVDLPDSDVDACPNESDAVVKAKDDLERRLILPEIVKAVNTAPQYAAVRRLFVTRVIAQWIRDRHAEGRPTSFDDVLDSGDLGLAPLTSGWKPLDVFDDYVKAFRSKEFTYTTTTTEGGERYRHTYVTGGVDLTTLKLTGISAEQMAQEHADLPGAVASSLERLTTSADGSTWLGGSVPLPERNLTQRLSDAFRGVTGSRLGTLLLVLGGLAVLVLGFRGGSRRRGRPAT
ncbi:hypothetical protein [Kineosporia succinea]|uniref:Uncharacterized protein n=1 Tax=Kineosporia succinea TaxID=84632 RepID=A0ABT9P9D4_9ACTN|nr:hypothetical protein [Kineosporia succinea]MDP9829309.1 hypothetical protein [Kineosporia succinea]